jgi:hypothetical protein
MEKNCPEILLEHIEEAQDWLEKAKDEYVQSNSIRGEMILNLAQAEVRHAWELSRRQSVSDNVAARPKKRTGAEFKARYLLPAAASIIVLSGVIIWSNMGKIVHKSPTAISSPSPVANMQTKMAEDVTPKEAVKKLVSKADSDADAAVVERHPSVRVAPVPETSAEMVAVSAPTAPPEIPEVQSSEQRNARTGISYSRVQPVSQLLIDEEALTREATHSLRHGK